MEFSFRDRGLELIREKLSNGQRLQREDGCYLYRSHDLIGVGRLADEVRRRHHANRAYFVYNQHLNYTNICINCCRFCAYAREEGQAGAFVLSMDEIKQRLLARGDEPIRELHVVGGVNPALPFEYYLELLATIRSVRPAAAIKAFTAVEIDHLAAISQQELPDAIAALKRAGLAMVPGGGAEVMSDRVQAQLFPGKIGGRQWLEVMRALHRAGISSNATMLYGHIESIPERVEHLIKLRTLQDETGGFTAFIPLAFHAGNTRLAHLPATTAWDDLKNVAVARLMLDNFDHIKAYWVMIGEKLAQVALSFGADDLDGTIIEEKISHMAGARSAPGLSREHLVRLIQAAGYEPVERDAFYQPVSSETVLPGRAT